ncbi:hypothetical protein FKM82_004253 [Ascaphus truei]
MLQLTTHDSIEQKKGSLRQAEQYHLAAQQDRNSPSGDTENIYNVEDEMFRSVEGQAASDEEEEKWAGDQHCQAAEVKKLLARLSCCASGCDDKMVKGLLSYVGRSNNIDYRNTIVALVEIITRLTEQLDMKEQEAKKLEMIMEECCAVQMKDPLIQELEKKVEEIELLRVELQMLETERVRLSLVEEKLLDVLQLLQQLRHLKISKRALGKLLLGTLEACREPHHEKAHVCDILDTLHHELSACDLFQPSNPNESHQSLTNSLVISC